MRPSGASDRCSPASPHTPKPPGRSHARAHLGPCRPPPHTHTPPQPPAFLHYGKNMATREKSFKSPVSKVIFQHSPACHPRRAEALTLPKTCRYRHDKYLYPCHEIPIPIGRDSPAVRRRGRDDKRLLNTHIKRQSKARGKVFQDKMATPSGKEKPNP